MPGGRLTRGKDRHSLRTILRKDGADGALELPIDRRRLFGALLVLPYRGVGEVDSPECTDALSRRSDVVAGAKLRRTLSHSSHSQWTQSLPMAENQPRPKSTGKKFKLFLIIVACLLVPIAMDQVDIDREKVRLAGRIAVGVAVLLFAYGLFTKMLKVMGFVVFLLIALVFLVAEGHVKAPKVKEWFAK